MLLSRQPRPALRPFLKLLWRSDEAGAGSGGGRELVLPTGGMHLVIRLDQPLRVHDGPDDRAGRLVGHEIVGGARGAFYVRSVEGPMRSVGALLQPGAARWLLGAPAGALAGRHTPLADLWGAEAGGARARLLEAPAEERLDLWEALLASRLPRVSGVHPAVAHALARFDDTSDVGAVVTESGYSHRRFIALFEEAVGLTPKRHCRVRRFQEALRQVAARPAPSLSDLALAAGYSDQSHFNREFHAFAGVTPGEYRRLSPRFAHHVRLPAD